MTTPREKKERLQGGRVVFPGAEKLVAALIVQIAAKEPGFGLVAILTQNALIVGTPAGSTSFLSQLIEGSEDKYRQAFKEEGLTAPITGGVICLSKAQVRPFVGSTINVDELAVFSEEIVAIAPGTNMTMTPA